MQRVVGAARLRGGAWGTPKRRQADLAGRAPMRSPGRPPVARREERQRFWAAIADGLSSEEAGGVAGVSPAVGVRWFRVAGCDLLIKRRRPAGICRSLNARRSPS